MKLKKCRQCGELFERNPKVITLFCSNLCELTAKAMSNLKEIKKQKAKKKREFKQNDKPKLMQKCQSLANKYARIRDERLGRGCITCGTKNAKWDGGHFLPTSTYSSIRFYTLQIHKQCFQCNRINSGKPREYREAMINMHGIEWVEKLESTKNITRKYTVEYLNKYLLVIGRRLKKITNRMNNEKGEPNLKQKIKDLE